MVIPARDRRLLDTDTVAIVITATNHAPTLDASSSPKLTDVTYQSATNNGMRVADIFSALAVNPITISISGDSEGIAIVASDTSHGSWEYSLDDGTSWLALGTHRRPPRACWLPIFSLA